MAEAGDGASGRVVELVRRDAGLERARVVLDALPSMSVVPMFKRDEIVGPAALAEGPGGPWLIVNDLRATNSVYTLADAEPAVIVEDFQGNLHALAYNPVGEALYGVRPDIGDLITLRAGEPPQVRVRFAPLDAGQDPIPVAIRPESGSARMIVALLSGEVCGARGPFVRGPGSNYGNNFLQGHGRVVACDPASGEVETLIDGLTLPSEVQPFGAGLLVLELCDALLEPLLRPEQLERPCHGGMRRFSGRLLYVELTSGRVTQLASGLDMPTNLFLDDEGFAWISQGAGTPGRPIPGPRGDARVSGFIEAVDLRGLEQELVTARERR